MSMRPRPKPRHHPANLRARRLNESLGGFGMCNGPCGNYKIPARKCLPGAGHPFGEKDQAETHNAAKLNDAGGVGINPDSAIPR